MENIPTFEQLPEIAGKLLEKVERIENLLDDTKKHQRTQRFDFDGALAHLNESGYAISVSKLQKLCADKKIPVHKFNNHLYFELSELNDWVNDNTY